MLPLVGVTLLIGVGGFLAVAVMVGVIVALAFAIGPWAALPGAVIGIGGTIALVYVYVKLSLASPALGDGGGRSRRLTEAVLGPRAPLVVACPGHPDPLRDHHQPAHHRRHGPDHADRHA